jgi:hypothetical protein
MNITADDHYEMCARADFALEVLRPDADKLAFLVDGYVGGPGMITTARRQYPNQYLHYHRAGHGAVTSPSSKRGYTAFVLGKMSRLQGASGIHVGTMGYGKMEGEGDDKIIAYMIERDECQGPVYFQKWYGMKPTTPIVSGGMNALRLPGFFQNLGHGNVINTAGGGSYGHIDSPADGCALAAAGLRMLEGRRRPDRVGEDAPRIRPRLRILPEGRRRPLSGLARKARRRGVVACGQPWRGNYSRARLSMSVRKQRNIRKAKNEQFRHTRGNHVFTSLQKGFGKLRANTGQQTGNQARQTAQCAAGQSFHAATPQLLLRYTLRLPSCCAVRTVRAVHDRPLSAVPRPALLLAIYRPQPDALASSSRRGRPTSIRR